MDKTKGRALLLKSSLYYCVAEDGFSVCAGEGYVENHIHLATVKTEESAKHLIESIKNSIDWVVS